MYSAFFSFFFFPFCLFVCFVVFFFLCQLLFFSSSIQVIQIFSRFFPPVFENASAACNSVKPPMSFYQLNLNGLGNSVSSCS